ncbi:MAG TPA: heat-inducible transcriptional repressor HrcA [Candidatus Acidoferrales bacterium]|nr:heat-inducible transcriptional repressor HrcA [Candidatus Acidoferrales bacterium]
MRDPVLQERRTRQILADVVRTYIETGEPVSSRSISKRYSEQLSPATIRNVMVELVEGGYLFQPHTSAGRVPTATAYRVFAQMVAANATLSGEDEKWIRSELAAAQTPDELVERAGHVLAMISQALGIVVAPPIGKTLVEHLRFLLLPDGRVLVVLISSQGATRDKILQIERRFTQQELDRTAEYLNRHYSGRTLEAIREDLLATLARERERYDSMVSAALALCDPKLLGNSSARDMYVEGAAQMAATSEFTSQAQLQDLLAAIEEKHKLIALLNTCIDSPEPVHVQIGIEEMSSAGSNLALISAAYSVKDQPQGSLGVLGPARMQYERAITAVAYVARLLSDSMSRSSS